MLFLNPISFYSQWFIPIPIPDLRFSLVLSHSHWLFSLPPAPTRVLLVVSHQITDDQ